MSDNQRKWQYLIEFYEDFIDCGHDLLPLLNLVKWLSASKYKDEIYAVTSMATLLISSTESFQEQKKFPSIGIQYYNLMFKITYAPTNQTHNLEKYKCHQTQVFSLLESLFIRLNIETKIKQLPISDYSDEKT